MTRRISVERVKDGESPSSLPGVAKLPNRKAIDGAWRDSKRRRQEVFDAGDLKRIARYRNTKGIEFRDARRFAAVNLVAHGANRRRTGYGFTPAHAARDRPYHAHESEVESVRSREGRDGSDSCVASPDDAKRPIAGV